jgi:hypothetical protein
MGSSSRLRLSALFLVSQAAAAQTVIEDYRSLASDTPEAWAMRYFAGTTLMTSLGETARLAPWDWNIAFDLGSITVSTPPRAGMPANGSGMRARALRAAPAGILACERPANQRACAVAPFFQLTTAGPPDPQPRGTWSCRSMLREKPTRRRRGRNGLATRRGSPRRRGWLHDVHPLGTGPTRPRAMIPERPLLLPPVKL